MMLRELKTLVAVSLEGTFAAAGERIGLTQAAISAQMQRLEADLGFELFDRTGRSAKLNLRGQRTLKQAHEVLRLYASLGSDEVDSAGVRSVTMGAIASVQRGFLPEVLIRASHEYGPIRSRVIPGLSPQLLDSVGSGDAEFAAIIRPPHSLQSDLRWTPLVREPFRLLVPRAVSGDDWATLIATQPFVRYDRASYGGRQVDRFLRTSHLVVRDVCEFDELESIVRLVAGGMGVALIPETSAISQWPETTRAIDLGPNTFHRDIGVVHRAPRELSQAVRLILSLLTKAYEDQKV